MIDIDKFESGDIVFKDTNIHKASNILKTQLGSLAFNESFGVDVVYFLNRDLKFQNESFKSYLLQKLSENGIVISENYMLVDKFIQHIGFGVNNQENTTSLIAE